MYIQITEQEAPATAGKRERTRSRLIQCASELVGEKGFERTTLEEIAKRAGVTRGSIYSNFSSREELLLEVAASLWEPVAPPMVPGAPLAEQMRLLAEAVISALPLRRKRAIGAASFVAYALTHEQLRSKLCVANEKIYDRLAAQLKSAVAGQGLPMPASEFVRVVHALIEGIFTLSSLTPDLLTADMIRQAFQILATTTSDSRPGRCHKRT